MCGLKAWEPWIKLGHVINISTALFVPTVAVWYAGTPTDTCAATAGSAYNVGFDGVSASGGGGGGGGGGDDDSSLETALGGTLLMLATIVLFMKLVSYAHVNLDYRLAAKEAAHMPMDQVGCGGCLRMHCGGCVVVLDVGFWWVLALVVVMVLVLVLVLMLVMTLYGDLCSHSWPI